MTILPSNQNIANRAGFVILLWLLPIDLSASEYIFIIFKQAEEQRKKKKKKLYARVYYDLDLLIDGGMSAAMSYDSDLMGDIRSGPLCRADGIRVASVGPADGLQYWDHACPGAHALDVVELTVTGARSTIKQSPPSATKLVDSVQTIKKRYFFFFFLWVSDTDNEMIFAFNDVSVYDVTATSRGRILRHGMNRITL